ncbi:ATP-binding cassette domain-containing protein [Mycobacterium avium subsp. hominissuis]|uniref:ABC transporter ATP-binding protein n=1 Tax=Mycobacterium avium TaxID=1764 RepID=A0A2A2ZN97_MYCAV|nr:MULTISPECIES: ATP-binding cassette domain-containing protein [Mycobacteriaceae]MDO2384325.1 ATP-binding cassette domain-containing protein [Mycobacterium avium subsp. hominissuis]MDO2395303.1 ATP-binding cassette domain-containing protein [Mycobacterium avium subsp. hominissuis]PBA27908.1 ABC transporter ATP-binding protein [Mycobacterium avium]RUP32515.1 MAG: ATP-binding cassette domain-containing protein [Mycolicibacterium sp.]
MGSGMVAPPLVVRLGDAMFTFPPGKEVVVGRGEGADVRIDVDSKQAISRTHMVLRVEGGQWVAVDKSRNGIYADGIRVQTIAVDDSIPIALGAATGPKLIFKTATQVVPAARLATAAPPAAPGPAAPPRRPVPLPARGPQPPYQPPTAVPPARPSGPVPQPRPTGPLRGAVPPVPQQFSPPPLGQQPPAPRAPQGPPSGHAGPPSGSIHRPAGPPPRPASPPPRPAGPPPAAPSQPAPGWPNPAAAAAAPPAPRPLEPSPADEADALAKVTGMVKRVLPQRGTPALPPGAITIGRHSTSAIRVDDTLASRTHAYLLPAPTGMQIHDNHSNNGIFVNGVKVPAATLQLGDVVTIGNTDLVFTGVTLEPRTAAAATGGLQAHQVGLTIDGYQLLTSVSFAARPGTLTAVIGPSGAGKSTLIKLLAGATQPTSGQVTFDGHDVHAHYASLRSRIGVVPQDDVVHRQLTVDQALDYAAKLRLPADTSKADRRAVVESVLAELELTQHRAKRVEKLSGGQRKRASVAMELLTGPSLLILDEPTSGLDPALDRQVMSMLRKLADAGRTVIVVTHSLTYLSMCDQVLLLAPGGKTAYAGRPDGIEAAMGTTDWADIFAWVSAKPDDAHAVFLHNNPAAAQPAAAAGPAGPLGEPARTSTGRQVLTLMGRQVRLILADRGYAVFLALLPLVMGALCLVVPGKNGLGVTKANGPSPSEPAQLLSVLIIAAVFMGTALTIRDLVGERSIFRREQSVGLSAGAYLTAKVVVYSVAAAAQTAIVVALVVALKGGPARGALAFGSPVADLYAALALTAVVSAIVGLLLSALARSGDWIMPMLVVMIMSAIVFSGGLIPVSGRAGLNQLSFLLPARWGFAASASTVDLMTANALNTVDDPLWRHQLTWWLTDVGILLALGVAATIVVARLLRLPSTDATGAGGRTTMSIVVVIALLGGFVAGASYLTRGSHIRDHAATADLPNMPAQGAPPSQKPVAAGDLAGLLPDASAVGGVMGSTMTVTGANPATTLAASTVDPAKCAGVTAAGTAQVYGPSNPTGVAGLSFTSTDPNVTVTEYVLGYPDADHAASVQSDQINAWHPCARTTANLAADGQPPSPVAIGEVSLPNGHAAADLTMGSKACRHVLVTDSNVLIDVLVCGPNAGAHADDVVAKITDKIH